MRDILEEVKKTKAQITKMLGMPTASNRKEVDKKVGREDDKEPELKESDEIRMAKGMVREILGHNQVRILKSSEKKAGDSFVGRYWVELEGKKRIVKLILLYEIKQVSLSLWEDGEQEIVDLIFVGKVRDFRKLIAVGNARIKSYVK